MDSFFSSLFVSFKDHFQISFLRDFRIFDNIIFAFLGQNTNNRAQGRKEITTLSAFKRTLFERRQV